MQKLTLGDVDDILMATAMPGTRDPLASSEPRLTRTFRNSLGLTYAGD